MLQLLLDEHISRVVAQGLRRRHRKILVVCLVEWQAGRFLGESDATCLEEAAQQKLTLVTYDRRTIPILLKSWAEEGRKHGGVIFVDDRTIAPSDHGGLVRALGGLWRETAKWDWTDRACFVQR